MKARCCVFSFVVLMLACAPAVVRGQATNLYWTVSAGGLTGGTALWGGSNWTTSSTGGISLTTFSQSSNIFFQDTLGSLTYDASNTATLTIGSITVANSNVVTLDNSGAGGVTTMTIGGPITVQGASTLVINMKNWGNGGAPNTVIQAGSALDFSYSSGISQNRSMTLGAISFGSGGGTLAVVNNSTATTQLLLSATDLTGDSTDMVLLGSNTSSHPTSLTFTTTDSLSSFAGPIAGFGFLVKAGSGLMTLSGVNTYSSSTAISGGTLVLGGAGLLGGGNYAFSIANSGAFVVSTSSNQTFSGVISGSGGLYQNGSGRLTLASTAANTYTGPTTIGGGTLQIGNGGANGSLASGTAITLNGALAFARSDSVNFTNAITGGGVLYQLGSGSLTLAGSNSYSGATYVNNGSLFINAPNSTSAINMLGGTTLGGSGSAPSALVTVGSNGTIKPGSNGVGSLALGGLTFSSSGAINVGNFGNYSSLPAISVAGSNGLTTSGPAGAVTINISGAAPLNINSNLRILAYSGAIQGSGIGGFSANSLGVTGLPGRGATFSVTGTDAGFVDVYYAADYDLWTGAQDGTNWNSTSVNWTLASSSSAISFQSNDPVVFDDSAGSNTTVAINAGNVSPFSAIFKNNSTSYTLQGPNGITGPAGLFMSGNGTLTITNSNGYTGGTTLNAGLLNIANSAALGSAAGAFTINGGSIDNASGAPLILINYPMSWNGNFTYIGSNPLNLGTGNVSLGGSRTLNLGGNVLTVGGVISGPYSLTETGSGTLLLTAANTYIGNTLVSGGTLLIGNPAALQNSTVDTSGAGLLSFGSQTSATFAGLVNGGGLSLTNTAAQAVNLFLGNSGVTSSYGGALSGSGGIIKIGGGTLYLTGSNGYAGATTVSAGTLQFQGGNSLPSASPISLGSATLQVRNDGVTSGGTINVANSITLSLQTTTDTINVGNLATSNTGNTVAFGVLSNGTSSNNFNSQSTFNFTGANGYLQSFTALNLSGSGGQGTTLNPTTTTVLILGNVTNQENGNSGTNFDTLTLSGSSRGNLIAGTISDAADYVAVGNGDTRITMAGTGQWILAGSNTNHGPTTISGGTLQLGTGGNGQDGSINNTSGVTNSGVLVYNLFGSQTAPYVISGAGTLTKNGGGTITLTASDNYTGPTNVLAGTLALGAGGSINSTPTISLANSATFDVTAKGAGYALQTNQVLAGIGNTSVAGTMAVNSTATVLPGGVASAGTLTVGALTLNTGSVLKYDLSSSGSFDLINVTGNNGLNLLGGGMDLFTSNGTAQFSVPGTYTIMNFSGSVAGSVSNLSVLNQNSIDTYTFSTSGSALLLTIVNANVWNGGGGAGAFNWSNSANWSQGASPVSGQPITFSGAVGLSNTNDISGLNAAGLVFTSSAGAFNLSGNSIQLSGGVVNSSTAAQTISLNMGLTGGNQTITAAAGNIILAGAISDGGANLGIVTAGSHTVYLTAANTFSGPTNVSAGTLNLSNSLALQDSTLTDGRIVFDQSVGSHAFTLGGLSGSGNISLVDNGGNPVALSEGNNNASTNYNGVLSGSGSLTLIGSGTLTLGGANTFNGTTFVGSGALVLGNSAALQNSTFDTNSPGALSFGSQTTVVLGGLINGGSIVLANTASQPVALAVGNNGLSSSYSGAMSGNGGTLAMVGNGTFYVSGSNTYTGPTGITSGTMQFQGSNSLPGGSLIGLGTATLQIRNDGPGSGGTINAGNNVAIITNSSLAVIDVGNNGSLNTGNTVAFGVLGNGNAANAFMSTIVFRGENGYIQSYSGLGLSGLTGQATTLDPTSVSVIIAGNVTNQESGSVTGHFDTLDLDGITAGNLISGVISDNANFVSVGNGDTRLVKSNNSVWTLTGANTYSGPTTIMGGTLVIGGAGVLGGGNYSNTIANSGTFVMNTTSNQTLGGVISGNGAFYQQGSGATTLTASNTYSGPTSITAGTLALGVNAGISQSPSILLGNGATLDVSAQGANFHLTSGQTLSGTGNYSINGAMTANSGSFILPGGATSSGTLNVGALTLSPGGVLSYNLGSGQDLINVGGILTVNGGGFNLYAGDGMTSFSTPGSYPLADYAGGFSGLASTLSVLNPNPYETYSFSASGGVLSVNIVTPITWNGGGSPSFNWSNTANWTNSQTPASGNAVLFTGTTGLANVNDIVGLNLTSMTFSNSAGAFNLSGNSIQLSGPIANYSTAAQTIGMNIGLSGGNQTLNAAAGTIAVTGVISDGGAGLGINTTGSGTVVLAAANTYTGPTNILAGNLSLAHSLAAQYSTVNLAGGGLSFAAGVTAPTLGGLSGSGGISLATAASEPVSVNVGGNGQSTTYAGALSGPGGLVKQGAGMLTLTASQGYSGPTNITGGTLQLQGIQSPAAGGIGIQFQGGGTAITGSDGVYPISHWNVIAGGNPLSPILINSASAATTASFVMSSGNSGASNTSSSIPLLSGYIYKKPAATITVTLSGIPYANYSLYAYSADQSVNQTNALTLGGTTYYFNTEQDSTFDQITNTNPAMNPAGNYAVATGLGGASQTVTIYSSQEAAISGFEIVNTPVLGTLPAATPVTISNGATLDITNLQQSIASLSSTDGMGSQVLLGNGVLTIAGTAATTFDGVISGTVGSLVLQGGGLTLTGVNTFGQNTTVSGGLLQLSASGGPALASNLAVSGGSAQLLQSNQIVSSGSVSVSAGLLNISGNSNTLAGVQITGGTIAGTTGVLTATAPYDAQTGVISAILGGNVGLNKSTSGTVVLAASNTYTGTTNLYTGTLTLVHPLAVQNSTVNVYSGVLGFVAGNTGPTLGGLSGGGNVALATAASQAVALNVGGNGQSTTYSGALSGPGSLVKQGSGTLTLTSTQSFSGPTLISGGVLQLVSPMQVSVGNLGIGVHFAGTGGTQTGSAGVVSISNWNNFKPANPANQALIDSTSAASGATLTVAGATNNNGASHSTVQILNTFNYTNMSGGLMTVTVNNIPYAYYNIYAYSVDTSPGGFNDEQMTIGNAIFYYTPDAGQTLNGMGNFYNQITNTTPGTYPEGNYMLVSAMSGASQTLTVAGAKPNSTGTEFGAFSSVEIVQDTPLGLLPNLLPVTTPVTISNGGTLDMTNNVQTIASLSSTDGMGSQVLVGSGVLTVAGPAVTTFDGVISGLGGSLNLQSGRLTLTGSNTYSGATAINGGTLQLGTGSNGQDGSIANTSGVTDNSALVYNLAGSQTANYVITGTGSVTKTGPGTLVLANPANFYSGGTNIQSGLLVISSLSGPYGALPIGPLTITGGSLDMEGTLPEVTTLNGTGTIGNGAGGPTNTAVLYVENGGAFSGTIRDGGFGGIAPSALELDGGTLVLSGTNTFSGGTTVIGGALILDVSQALASGSGLVVGGDANSIFAPVAGPAAAALPAASAVPEPGTLALLVMAGVFALAAARRRMRDER